ncbi:MAG: cupin domain-containing protein [Pseudomonadota bacterium]
MQNSSGGVTEATAVPVQDLASYAGGAIVSRTLAKAKGGSFTFFAFDQGQELSEHSAPFDAYVQVLDGEAELIIGGKSVRARVGELVRMPANIPHAVKANQRFKMLLVMIRDLPEGT